MPFQITILPLLKLEPMTSVSCEVASVLGFS